MPMRFRIDDRVAGAGNAEAAKAFEGAAAAIDRQRRQIDGYLQIGAGNRPQHRAAGPGVAPFQQAGDLAGGIEAEGGRDIPEAAADHVGGRLADDVGEFRRQRAELALGVGAPDEAQRRRRAVDRRGRRALRQPGRRLASCCVGFPPQPRRRRQPSSGSVAAGSCAAGRCASLRRHGSTSDRAAPARRRQSPARCPPSPRAVRLGRAFSGAAGIEMVSAASAAVGSSTAGSFACRSPAVVLVRFRLRRWCFPQLPFLPGPALGVGAARRQGSVVVELVLVDHHQQMPVLGQSCQACRIGGRAAGDDALDDAVALGSRRRQPAPPASPAGCPVPQTLPRPLRRCRRHRRRR